MTNQMKAIQPIDHELAQIIIENIESKLKQFPQIDVEIDKEEVNVNKATMRQVIAYFIECDYPVTKLAGEWHFFKKNAKLSEMDVKRARRLAEKTFTGKEIY